MRKSLPTFDYVEYTRIEEELHQATNVKPKPVDQKIPPVEIVAALIDAAKQLPQLAGHLAPSDRQRHHLAWRRDLAIVLALKSSGLRVGELVSLIRGDLDYGRQGAWVTGKGRKTRFAVFDDEAWAAIQVYLEERSDETLPAQVERYPLFCRHDRKAKAEARLPLSTRAMQRIIEELSEQANLSGRFNFSPHSLRHYFANGLLELTGNMPWCRKPWATRTPRRPGAIPGSRWNRSSTGSAPWAKARRLTPLFFIPLDTGGVARPGAALVQLDRYRSPRLARLPISTIAPPGRVV